MLQWTPLSQALSPSDLGGLYVRRYGSRRRPLRLSYGYINAAKEATEGFDFGVHSPWSFADNNKLIFDLNTTYIKDLTTTFCSVCTSTDLANTTGEPLKFRARGAVGWSNGIFSSNAAVNFANAYHDTGIGSTGRISSFTTTDINLRWRIPRRRLRWGLASSTPSTSIPHTPLLPESGRIRSQQCRCTGTHTLTAGKAAVVALGRRRLPILAATALNAVMIASPHGAAMASRSPDSRIDTLANSKRELTPADAVATVRIMQNQVLPGDSVPDSLTSPDGHRYVVRLSHGDVARNGVWVDLLTAASIPLRPPLIQSSARTC